MNDKEVIKNLAKEYWAGIDWGARKALAKQSIEFLEQIGYHCHPEQANLLIDKGTEHPEEFQPKHLGSVEVKSYSEGYNLAVEHMAKAVKQARAEAVEIIGSFTDADECSLDHHGNCQAHGYSAPCPMPKAKEYLTNYRQEG